MSAGGEFGATISVTTSAAASQAWSLRARQLVLINETTSARLRFALGGSSATTSENLPALSGEFGAANPLELFDTLTTGISAISTDAGGGTLRVLAFGRGISS